MRFDFCLVLNTSANVVASYMTCTRRKHVVSVEFNVLSYIQKHFELRQQDAGPAIMFTLHEFFLKRRSTQAAARRFSTIIAISSFACIFVFLSGSSHVLDVDHVRHSGAAVIRRDVSTLYGPEVTCNKELEVTRVLVVLRVHASYSNTRTYVREKIANSTHCRMRVVFLYGEFIGEKAKRFQKIISEESELFEDILQIKTVRDYHLHGQQAVDSVRGWIAGNPCSVYQHVVFGTFQLPVESRYHAKRYGKEEESWAMDDCLKFSLFKRTNAQYFAHFFPPRASNEVIARVNKRLSHSSVYEMQDIIVTPHQYKYLLSPNKGDGVCGNVKSRKNYLAIIAVHSAAPNFINRNFIRSTWGQAAFLTKHRVGLLFFLGQTERKAKNEATKLRYEMDTYQDMIQEDFVDKYKNMTLKQVAVLKYLSQECSHVHYRYLLKTDDDIVMDLRSISRYVARLPKAGLQLQRAIYCFHVNELAYVPRYADKWYVSRAEYPDDLYPAYCSGAGYLIPKHLVPILYDASLHVRTFWVDDTYISGMLPKVIGDVSIIQIPKQKLSSLRELWNRRYTSLAHQMLVHVQQDLELFQIYWTKFSAVVPNRQARLNHSELELSSE